jgi:thiol-disulfide isomerase/thioredoxin
MRLFVAIGLMLLVICATPVSTQPGIIAAVRGAILEKEWLEAERIVRDNLTADATRLEAIEAFSWIGRGALADGQLNRAIRVAREVERLVETTLDGQPLMQPSLATALGASFEVQAQVLAAWGNRSDAVHLLNGALKRYRHTAIHMRIQKNIHLLSLVRARAPDLDTAAEVLGNHKVVSALSGRPTLLFFWAHWCSDCKAQVSSLEKIYNEFGSDQGLELIAPTQRYGYTMNASEVSSREQEREYIEKVYQQYYQFLSETPAPLSRRNFENYGVSTTPTLILIDANGIVQLYHPGMMSETELHNAVRKLMMSPSAP